MDGSLDLRALTALKRSVGSRVKKEGANLSVETIALVNFKNLAVAASSLGPKQFHTISSKDVLDTVAKVREEGYELPYKLKFNILMREVNKIAGEKKYSELVHIISPWASTKFEHTNPQLSGVSESASVRLTTFKAVLFEQLLLPMLMRGEEQADAVQVVASECLNMTKGIDFVSLDAAGAVAMDEVVAIFEGLQALGTSVVDPKFQDIGPSHMVVVAAELKSTPFLHKTQAYMGSELYMILPSHVCWVSGLGP